MIAKEQLMSETKRDNSAYHQSVTAARAYSRSKPARPEPRSAPDWEDLRVLGSWQNAAASSGDPYNGIGARAVTGQGHRR